MKKTKSTILFIILITLLYSCKKDNSIIIDTNTSTNNFMVTDKGFLRFSNISTLISFYKKINNPATRDSIQNLISENGFKGKMSNLNSRNSDSTNPYDLIFNADGLLEIDNVILKISADEKFIYTLKEEFASSENFSNLVNEVYDALTMNKINVDRNETNFNFSEFMNANPYGRREALNNAELRRPMFGIRDGQTQNNVPFGNPGYNPYGNCQQMVCEVTPHTQYVFWIAVDHWNTYDNCHFIPSVGC